MKKVKVLLIVKNLTTNGISKVVLNYGININKKIFDLSIFAGLPIEDDNVNIAKDNNISTFIGYNKDNSKFRYYCDLIKVLKHNKYDIVHVNGNSVAVVFELLIAKILGVKKVILHMHSINTRCGLFSGFLKRIVNNSYDVGLACSKEAGDSIFLKKYFVLENAFEIDKYKFSSYDRVTIRKKLKVENEEILLGNVGGFTEYKNQDFVLKLMDFIKKNKVSNIKCLFIGDGSEFSSIKNKAKALNLEKQVIFLGNVIDAHKYYNAMDIFVFPSKLEGLGLVLLEAQINGLYCISSDVVPTETKITNNIVYEKITNDSVNEWIGHINKFAKLDRITNPDFIRDINQYDIVNSVNKIEQIYIQLYEKGSEK